MCMFMWTVHFPFQFRLFICDMNSFMIGSPKKTPYLNKNRITREFINEINQRLVILDVSLSTFGYLALSSLTSGKSVHFHWRFLWSNQFLNNRCDLYIFFFFVSYIQFKTTTKNTSQIRGNVCECPRKKNLWPYGWPLLTLHKIHVKQLII